MPEVSATLAGYRIERVIGKGGMGIVYEATQLSLERQVALKVIAADLGDDVEFRERFRREGMQQAALDHPHIVPIYEAGEADGRLYIAMRLIRGSNLKDRVASGELTPAATLDVLAQIASALDAAHTGGRIHRDVKPQNILVDGEFAYLADFGLAKGAGDRSLTKTGRQVGSLDYISPEQIRGEPATAASDVYALAAVLYECLAGEVPYPRESDAALLYAHLQEPPRAVSLVRPQLPAAMDDVIRWGMAKVPAERPATAGELIRDAQRALAEAAPAAVTATAPPASPASPGRSRETVVDAPRARPAAAAAVETSPKRGARTRRGAWKLAGAATVAAVAALAAGWLVGRGTAGSSSTSTPSLQRVGGAVASVALPGNWSRSHALVSSLPLSGGVAVHGAGTASLQVGLADSPDAALLPAPFERRVSRLPAPTGARAGAYAAYRYRALRVRGVRARVDVFAVPTSRGAVVVACTGDCASVLATLRLHGVSAYPLGPSTAFASGLNRALRALDAARVADRRKLREATAPAAQASAAAKLASAYAVAASRVAAIQVRTLERPTRAHLEAALRAASKAYARLATAARKDDGAGFRAASSAVSAADAAAGRLVAGLKRLGYAVR